MGERAHFTKFFTFLLLNSIHLMDEYSEGNDQNLSKFC